MKIDTFFETSACVDICYKGRSDLLKEARKNGKIFTSHYSKMEIKKGYLNYLIYLHQLFRQLGSFGEVFSRVEKLNNPYHRRRMSSIIEQLRLTFNEEFFKTPIGNLPDQKKNIDELLTLEITKILHFKIRQFKNCLEKISDKVINQPDCFKDLEAPVLKEDGLFYNQKKYCHQSDEECQIYRFFQANKERFKAITDKLDGESIDEESQNRRTAIKELLKKVEFKRHFNNKQQVDAKLCWKCSDAILAVEAPKDSIILTSNEKHFLPICQAIDREENLKIYKP